MRVAASAVPSAGAAEDLNHSTLRLCELIGQVTGVPDADASTSLTSSHGHADTSCGVWDDPVTLVRRSLE